MIRRERRGISGEPISQHTMIQLIEMERLGYRRAAMSRIARVAPNTIARYFGPKRDRGGHLPQEVA